VAVLLTDYVRTQMTTVTSSRPRPLALSTDYEYSSFYAYHLLTVTSVLSSPFPLLRSPHDSFLRIVYSSFDFPSPDGLWGGTTYEVLSSHVGIVQVPLSSSSHILRIRIPLCGVIDSHFGCPITVTVTVTVLHSHSNYDYRL